MPNSTRPALVILDEDIQSAREIEAVAAAQFAVFKARSADLALQLLKTHSAAVIVVDQEFPSPSGLSVLKSAQTINPAARRVLIAAPGGLAETIEGLHSGVVERIIYKPIRSAELLPAITLAAAPAAPIRATA